MKKYVKADEEDFKDPLNTLEEVAEYIDEDPDWTFTIKAMMESVFYLIEYMEQGDNSTKIKQEYKNFKSSAKESKDLINTLINATKEAVDNYLEDEI